MNKITYTKHCEFCGTELTTPLSDDIQRAPEVNPEYKMTAETFVADSLVLSEYTLNYYKKQHAAIHTLDKYLTEKGIDAMVVAPKCTKGNSWATISKHVYSMIESLVAELKVAGHFCRNVLTYLLPHSLLLQLQSNISLNKKTIRKFRKAGAEIEFKILPGLNHIQACNQAYTAESIEFLLKH